MNINFSKLICLVVAFLIEIQAQISILSPKSLKSLNINSYEYAAFSSIKYGKLIRGFIYYSQESLCDLDNYPKLDPDFYYSDNSKPDNAIFIMTDQADICPYSIQAKNAKLLGAQVLMIIVPDNNLFNQNTSIEDKLLSSISLPVLLIQSKDIKLIKEEYYKGLDIQISIFFKKRSEDKLNIELYLRSDDLKSLQFFKEFKQYFDHLKKRVNFIPIYKYYECSDCSIDNSLNELSLNSCIKNNDYCGHTNNSK